MGQADLRQCAGKAEAMQKTEAECQEPGITARYGTAAGIAPQQLGGEKDDAQGNHCLDGRGRKIDEAEGRGP